MKRAVKHRDLGVTTRARAGLAVHTAAALALIPAYLVIAPDSPGARVTLRLRAAA